MAWRFFLGLSVVFGGCGGTNPSLYLLPAPAVTAPQQGAAKTIAVREVVLPDYARDARLSERRTDGSLIHLDGHRWADSPTRAVTRTLAATLRGLTGARVVVEPWPGEVSPDVVVAVHFDVFDATRSSQARLTGRIAVAKRGDTTSLLFRPFSIQAPVTGANFIDVMTALSTGLRSVAEEVVAVGL